MMNPKLKSLCAKVLTCSVLLTMPLMAGCGTSNAKQSKPHIVRPVKAIQLTKKSTQKQLKLPGVAKATQDTDLSFRVGGPLVSLNVDTGVYVKKGQVIAKIDPRDFQLRVNTFLAQLNSAKARLKETELQYHRYAKLIKTKAVAQSEYDRIKASYEIAQAQNQSALKALEDAKNALRDTALKAPFAGFINHKFVDNHETVKKGQPIASLVDLSKMEVRMNVAEDTLPLVRDFASFSCSFNALPQKKIKADLKEVAQKADPASRTYQVILSLDQRSSKLVRPGMSAEVSIDLANTENRGFVVPLTALLNRGGQKTFVWVIQAKTNQLILTPVKIVGLCQGGIEITGNLKKDQWIVTAGVNRLQEKQIVRLLSRPSKTNIGLEL